MLKRLFYLFGVILLILFFSIIWGCSSEPLPKNIIIVSLDTLRADHLGCYGYAVKTSPNIDALAQKAVRFSNVYSQSSWTLPSHMSFFTSRYPSFHKVLTNEHGLSPDIKTLAEIFKQKGYLTAAFTEGGNMFKVHGFGRGFDIYQEKSEDIDFTFKQAFTWLKKRKSKQSFLLFIHTYEIHTPYLRTELAAPEKRGRLPEVLRVNDFLYDIMYGRFALTETEKDYIRGLYDGGVLHADRYVGGLLKLLEELKMTQTTRLLIFSDHGEDLWDHGVSPAHGLTLYQDQLHVPVILYDPSLTGPRIVEGPVELIDFMPTLLAMNNIAIPPGLQGRNILPNIVQESACSKRAVFSEGTDYGPNKIAVIKDGYKYIYIPEPDKVKRNLSMKDLGRIEKNLSVQALFDLNADPLERNNIFTQKKQKANELQQLLEESYISRSRAIPEVSVKQALMHDQMERLRSLGYMQ